MKVFKSFMFILFMIFLQTKSYAISNKKIDDLAHAFMKENKVEGMSIAVINKGKSQLYNYGFANEFKEIPTSSKTLYTIASFTKTFTAALTAVAKVDHKINLDRSFNEYFPEHINNDNLRQMTPSMLLGHVSSLPFDFSPRPETFSAIVNSYQQFKPQQTPGSAYSYSNAGIGTMGYVLQKIYGKDYQKILDKNILQPLNMHSTYLKVPTEKEVLITLAHDKDNNIVPYDRNIEAWFAAASLKSSIADMAKYMHAQINFSAIKNKTLSKAIEMVHENRYCFSDKISCEQLAWQAHDITVLQNTISDTYFKNYDSNGIPVFDKKIIIDGNTLANHRVFIDKTGSGYGMSSYMAYIPDQKTGVVILINKSIGDARIRLGRDILLAYERSVSLYTIIHL